MDRIMDRMAQKVAEAVGSIKERSTELSMSSLSEMLGNDTLDVDLNTALTWPTQALSTIPDKVSRLNSFDHLLFLKMPTPSTRVIRIHGAS